MKLKNLNISIIDSGLIREHFAGTYVLENSGEVAIVEVSTSHAVDNIINSLKNLNIQKSDVKYIFVTHIHLDHAGGAGKLIKELPNAKLIVHPSGFKHMVDPSNLISGAIAVYGEEVVKKDYGDIIPIPKERIITCNDGEKFYIGNRILTTIFTPGHARHHISIFDSETMGIFSGDSMGLSYPEMTVDGRQFYQPTTTPTAFEYSSMLNSIDKMMDMKPRYIFFTHYGYSDKPEHVASQIRKRLKDYRTMVESLKIYSSSELKRLENKLKDYYIKESRQHGAKLSEPEIATLFSIDIALNAMGLIIWKQRKGE